jgi:hypothetical protein
MNVSASEAVSVPDVVTSFDSHKGRSEQSDQPFLSAGIRKHLRLGQSEGAASFHHAPTGNDALACGGSEKVDLELGGENPGVSRHKSKRCISRRAIGDGAHSSAVDATYDVR